MSRDNLPHLPRALHAAYDWTEAAGELDELRLLADHPAALASYATASAENAAEADSDLGTESDVFAVDIVALSEWLGLHPDDAPNYKLRAEWGGYDCE